MEVPLNPRLALGGAYSVYAIAGFLPKASLGPSVQLTVPDGSVIVDALRPVANAGPKVRVTPQLLF